LKERIMSEQMNIPETNQAVAAAQPAAATSGQKPTRMVSDPREVAAVVMARMKQVSAKKEELQIAINGLFDITRQLTRSYGEQVIVIEQLKRRIRQMETAAAASAPASGTVQ
jgi:hypothetical protein